MAALVVVAMVTFVILPAFQQATQVDGYRDAATAVRWKNGSMSRDEVRTLTASYQRSYQFLDRLAREVIQLGGKPTVPNFMQNGNELILGLAPPNSAVDVVQTKILADEARRHGVNISDDTVDLYIQELTNGKISQARYLELMRETAGSDLNRFQLYRYVKDEISKQLLLQMQAAGVTHNGAPLVTPSTNWQNFQRFEQRSKIETYPVFAENYLEEVTGQPTEKELRELYERGKNIAPQPADSPEFGFAKRYLADFEYVRGYQDKFLEAAKKELTEDQIRKEYDRRVANGDFRVQEKTGDLFRQRHYRRLQARLPPPPRLPTRRKQRKRLRRQLRAHLLILLHRQKHQQPTLKLQQRKLQQTRQAKKQTLLKLLKPSHQQMIRANQRLLTHCDS